MFRFTARGTVWVVLCLLFILAPLFAMLLGTMPPARSFWTEFSVALGYAGLAMMCLQFGLVARFRHVTAPWGEDVIYHFHRNISLVAVALVVAHPIILFVTRPELLALLNFMQAPWRARFAAISTCCSAARSRSRRTRSRSPPAPRPPMGAWKCRSATWATSHSMCAR